MKKRARTSAALRTFAGAMKETPVTVPFGVASGVEMTLRGLGLNPESDGLLGTPDRVERWLKEATAGYAIDPARFLSTTFDSDGYDQIVALRDIGFWSLCEHHLLPFYGTAAVAYLPSRRVVGLSKLARTVDVFARRLQIQERMTKQIADALTTHLKPRGVAVIVRGVHLCMVARGVRKENAEMITSDVRGCFRKEGPARAEIFALIS